MKHFNQFLFLAVAGIFFLTSCEKDPVEPGPQEPITFESGIFISCEGKFQDGNGSVDFLLGGGQQGGAPSIYNQVNSEAVGDVLQSLSFIDDKVYLVVNGDATIKVVDQSTFTKEAEITGFSSPRYMVENNELGYVTNLYTDFIQVVDLETYEIIDSVNLGEQSDQVLNSGNTLWTISPKEWMGRDKNHIYSVNLTDYSIDSLEVGWNPSAWACDEDSDMLYVYCRGKETDNGEEGAKIVSVDLISGEAVNSYDLGYTDKASIVTYDSFRDRVLFSQEDGIYTFDVNTAMVSSSPIIPLDQIEELYSTGVSPVSGDIYIGDANGFSEAGEVFFFSSDGQNKGGYQVGVAPNGFYFQ